MKKCKYCHVEKDLIEFPIKRDGNHSGISFRANSLKKDGSIEEFEKIIQYIKNNL